ncbi:alpha-1,2-fucosyltransferase super family [Candidatus Termititenax dinenymphae]|uniref:Alpha-1,2-fucosyltransferase super family n=1 Tax=Candidatus Termititenax dinenymphae TaxID=2218523 RepID=A0A388TLQ1_9BACT|nr:alpha-1,2-fucosyltransferase super family [Candidatus Termititenax dinenymphae]
MDYFALPALKIASAEILQDFYDFERKYPHKYFFEVYVPLILRRFFHYTWIPYKKRKARFLLETQQNRPHLLDIVTGAKPIYLLGTFQSYKYLESIKKNILADFSFKDIQLPEDLQKIMDEIKNTNSVAVHVRRGDYVTAKALWQNFGSICSLQYYRNAVEHLKTKFTDPKFYIFSNDPDWVKTNFTFLENYRFVDAAQVERADYYELFLMTQTKHNIIANSTFSWWGAYLNQNPLKTVIVPERWLGDDSITTDEICPPEWVRVSIK